MNPFCSSFSPLPSPRRAVQVGPVLSPARGFLAPCIASTSNGNARPPREHVGCSESQLSVVVIMISVVSAGRRRFPYVSRTLLSAADIWGCIRTARGSSEHLCCSLLIAKAGCGSGSSMTRNIFQRISQLVAEQATRRALEGV